MNFEDWYNINPLKDKLEELDLTEKEKKILTPVILNSSFIIEAKPFYQELGKIQKTYIVPDFLLKQFALTYKKRFLTAFSYYDLEKEINYLIKFVPAGVKLRDAVIPTDKYEDLLKEELKFFSHTPEKGFNELIKILNKGKLIGWKFKQPRQ